MKIISGIYGRRCLSDCSSFDLRPTTNKNRQALFNILKNNKFGFQLKNSVMADICCGSGVIGFEALSQGSKKIIFIDNNLKHLKIVEKNSQILQVQRSIKIISANVYNLPINEQVIDFLFVDPPYQLNYFHIINELQQKNWLQHNGLLVIEWGKKSNIQLNYFAQFAFLKTLDIRNYGETFFGFFLNMYRV
jgi:16S rRNA (guanine966-N2)-methyltransferase